ncbi:MAG: CU044_5270 family protein [Solirubrobacteraceae bacterium]|nr:CU044_5270 family protein [Solirubrobacteraceae bacterium]
MTQLEDFRSDLDESDPMALERARTRLRAAQGASGIRRRGVPRRRIGVAAAAGAAIVAAVAAILIGIGSTSDNGGLVPRPADAHAVLVDAASSAAGARDGGLTRLPEPDEFYFLEIHGTYRDGSAVEGDESKTKLNTRTYRRWESLTKPGLIETGSRQTPLGGVIPKAPTRHYVIGNERFSHARLASFDPDPQELYRRLLDGVARGQGSSPVAEVFVQLVDALRDVPLPPRLRATFLRTLAEVPGLQLTGPATDTLGRRGVGISYVERSRQDQRYTLILSDDGALLAVRQTQPSGSLIEDAVIVRQEILPDLPPAQQEQYTQITSVRRPATTPRADSDRMPPPRQPAANASAQPATKP